MESYRNTTEECCLKIVGHNVRRIGYLEIIDDITSHWPREGGTSEFYPKAKYSEKFKRDALIKRDIHRNIHCCLMVKRFIDFKNYIELIRLEVQVLRIYP